MDIHYFAAARAARGLAHERITTTAATLAELVDELGRLAGRGHDGFGVVVGPGVVPV